MASISGLPVLGSGWRPRSCCLCIRLRCNPLSMVNHKNHLFLILTPPSPSHKKHIWWFPKIGLPPVVIPSNNRFFHYKPSSYTSINCDRQRRACMQSWRPFRRRDRLAADTGPPLWSYCMWLTCGSLQSRIRDFPYIYIYLFTYI